MFLRFEPVLCKPSSSCRFTARLHMFFADYHLHCREWPVLAKHFLQLKTLDRDPGHVWEKGLGIDEEFQQIAIDK